MAASRLSQSTHPIPHRAWRSASWHARRAPPTTGLRATACRESRLRATVLDARPFTSAGQSADTLPELLVARMHDDRVVSALTCLADRCTADKSLRHGGFWCRAPSTGVQCSEGGE